MALSLSFLKQKKRIKTNFKDFSFKKVETPKKTNNVMSLTLNFFLRFIYSHFDVVENGH